MAVRITGRAVERIWGDPHPPEWTQARVPGGKPIGEVWFDGGPLNNPELLIKYLFTREKLSIQVHPNNEAARARGWSRGKSEAWYVYHAEPGAVIGAGLIKPVSKEHLRAAAVDGTIEELLNWQPVSTGDFLFSPAGMIHAIGAGLSLIEIQQNLDLTYRFYDYGRPRPLQLDESLAVVDPKLRPAMAERRMLSGVRALLHSNEAFTVEEWRGAVRTLVRPGGTELVLIPLESEGAVDGEPLELGSIWRVEQVAELELGPRGHVLAVYSGHNIMPGLLN